MVLDLLIDLRIKSTAGNLRVLRFMTACRARLRRITLIGRQQREPVTPMMLGAKTSITTMTTVTRRHR
jgi:hypothetical protein